MKIIVWMGLCLAAWAAVAQAQGAACMDVQRRAFVVVQSSGFAEAGTVLFPAPSRPDAVYCGAFTNGPLHLRYAAPMEQVMTNVFTFGRAAVTNIGTMTLRDFSILDRRSGKVFRRDESNGVYVCGEEFAILVYTNLLSRFPPVKKYGNGMQASLPMGFKRCLNLTNTLTLAEAQARGIDVKLREVLTLEIENDPQWGPTPVIRRRWVLSSEPFGEKITGPATTW